MKMLAALGASAVLLLLVEPAHACWDGWAARFGSVRIDQVGSATWSVETARELAVWLPQIDASVPSGMDLVVEHGHVSLRPSSGGAPVLETRWKGAKLEALYDAVARAVPAAHGRAKSAGAIVPLTVQVLAVNDRARAETFAHALDQRNLDEGLGLTDGFYTAGGFPAFNPAAHVIDAPAGTSLSVRVVVGAYLDRSGADATATLLRTHGIAAFVRPL